MVFNDFFDLVSDLIDYWKTLSFAYMIGESKYNLHAI